MNEINDIDRFSFFKSYALALNRFKCRESKSEFVMAIVEYVYYNIEPKFSKKELELKEMAWELVEPNLKTSKNKAGNAKKKEENQE